MYIVLSVVFWLQFENVLCAHICINICYMIILLFLHRGDIVFLLDIVYVDCNMNTIFTIAEELKIIYTYNVFSVSWSLSYYHTCLHDEY